MIIAISLAYSVGCVPPHWAINRISLKVGWTRFTHTRQAEIIVNCSGCHNKHGISVIKSRLCPHRCESSVVCRWQKPTFGVEDDVEWFDRGRECCVVTLIHVWSGPCQKSMGMIVAPEGWFCRDRIQSIDVVVGLCSCLHFIYFVSVAAIQSNALILSLMV